MFDHHIVTFLCMIMLYRCAILSRHEYSLISTNQYEHPPNISLPPEQTCEGSRRMPRRLRRLCHLEGRTLGLLASGRPEISETTDLGRHQQSGGINTETPDTRSIVTPSL